MRLNKVKAGSKRRHSRLVNAGIDHGRLLLEYIYIYVTWLKV